MELSCNVIRDKGSVALANALKLNSTLSFFDFYGNYSGNAGNIALCKLLMSNCSLTSLDLGCIGFGTLVKALAEALELNFTLTQLNLHYNNIKNEGAIALAKALETNCSLTSLNISSS